MRRSICCIGLSNFRLNLGGLGRQSLEAYVTLAAVLQRYDTDRTEEMPIAEDTTDAREGVPAEMSRCGPGFYLHATFRDDEGIRLRELLCYTQCLSLYGMEALMQKTDFIKAMADKAGLPQTTTKTAVDAVLAVIADTLKNGEKVTLTGFGTFKVRERQARQGVNPQTREKMAIPATKTPGFSASSALKASVHS